MMATHGPTFEQPGTAPAPAAKPCGSDDRRKGAWFGLAVGDALGPPYEFKSAAQIAAMAPATLQMTAGGLWEAGEWTDDTALTLATARAYDTGNFDASNAAAAMVKWLQSGPKDVGLLTRKALGLIANGQATAESAGRIAMQGNPAAAGNGSLMRAGPTGLVRRPADPRLVTESCALSCITHAEHRCAAACVAFNTVIASLVAGDCTVGAALSAGYRSVDQGEVRAIFERVASGQESMYRDDGGIGFVLLALERGLMALRYSDNFEGGLTRVIRRGGDSDTNGAVAGALLGALFGYDAVPGRWIEDLRDASALQEAFDCLILSALAAT